MVSLLNSGLCSQATALATHATKLSLDEISVFLSVLMAVFAMSACSFAISGHLRSGLVAYSAIEVFFSRNSLQVARVNTRTHSAQVVDVHTNGNRSDMQLIRGTMGVNLLLSAADTDRGVSASLKKSGPQPTPAMRFRGDVTHQSIQQWNAPKKHSLILSQRTQG